MKGDTALIEESFRRTVKSIGFLGFFDDSLKLKITDANGKPKSCLDVFSGVMADKMTHGDTDRDLVVMRHNFIL